MDFTGLDLRRVRLLATDLDGTLLRTDRTASGRTRSAIAAAVEHGTDVVFVTGRPPRWLDEVAQTTGHAGWVVAANGGVLAHLGRREITAVAGIAADVVLEVERRLSSLGRGFGFAVEIVRHGPVEQAWSGTGLFGHDPAYAPRWRPTTIAGIAPLQELLELGLPVKLLARAEPHDGGSSSQGEPTAGPTWADGLLAEAQEALSGLVEVTHSNPDDMLLEMSAAGVTKASALSVFAEGSGLSCDQVAAVGDMPNDLPMLEWAGMAFGVADAHQSVVDLVGAGALLPSNDDDGVALLLEAIVAATPRRRPPRE